MPYLVRMKNNFDKKHKSARKRFLLPTPCLRQNVVKKFVRNAPVLILDVKKFVRNALVLIMAVKKFVENALVLILTVKNFMKNVLVRNWHKHHNSFMTLRPDLHAPRSWTFLQRVHHIALLQVQVQVQAEAEPNHLKDVKHRFLPLKCPNAFWEPFVKKLNASAQSKKYSKHALSAQRTISGS